MRAYVPFLLSLVLFGFISCDSEADPLGVVIADRAEVDRVGQKAPERVAMICAPDMVRTGVGTCIDRFELGAGPRSRPLLGLSAIPETGQKPGAWDVQTMCADAGKRACRLEEWQRACAGSTQRDLKPYKSCTKPKGGTCELVGNRNPAEMRRLNASDIGGASSPSSVGAYDMLGNAEEWVRCPQGPDGWCQVGGHWSRAWTCKQPAIGGHSGRWHYFQSGGRCCTDAGAKPKRRGRGSLEQAIIALASVEAPSVSLPPSSRSATGRRLLRGFAELAAVYETAGAAGELVAPEVDGVLLAANGYFESRNQPRVSAGDKGWSVGAQQVSTGFLKWGKRLDAKRWTGLTRNQLRDPATNAAAAIEVLKHWRWQCTVEDTVGEEQIPALPGAWFTSYRTGRCSRLTSRKTRKVSDAGVRRCAVATALLERLGRKPAHWKCGHEGRRLSAKTRALVVRLRSK
jgi:hypothetical protein